MPRKATKVAPVVRPQTPRWVQGCGVGLAFAYFASIFLGSVGSELPRRVLPGGALYFTQVACLFTQAPRNAIDYRAEGWRCDVGRWEEIPVTPHFPIHPDDKESRFHRAMHFYRQNRPTMQALDEFLVTRHNASPGAERIGGVRLLSLRVPVPAPGTPAPRYARHPLASYPEEQRKHWYWTRESVRHRRCAKGAP
jgi:hypothetical protein